VIGVLGERLERESPGRIDGARLKRGPRALIRRFGPRSVGSGILRHQGPVSTISWPVAGIELMGLAVRQILARSDSPIFFYSRGLFVDNLTIGR
jgi:hypothetical protein